jgi:hypothetical protein
MWRLTIATWLVPALAVAETFTFTLGNPVASQDFRLKTAAFVFRTEGCADPAASQIGGTAEGLVKGTRTSVALKVVPGSRPGVYAVFQSWGSEGDWVVNLKGTCDGAIAGAVIPMGPAGFIRESSKFFPRPASEAEINAALKALSQGRHQ